MRKLPFDNNAFIIHGDDMCPAKFNEIDRKPYCNNRTQCHHRCRRCRFSIAHISRTSPAMVSNYLKMCNRRAWYRWAFRSNAIHRDQRARNFSTPKNHHAVRFGARTLYHGNESAVCWTKRKTYLFKMSSLTLMVALTWVLSRVHVLQNLVV